MLIYIGVIRNNFKNCVTINKKHFLLRMPPTTLVIIFQLTYTSTTLFIMFHSKHMLHNLSHEQSCFILSFIHFGFTSWDFLQMHTINPSPKSKVFKR